MNADRLIAHFGRISDAPDAVSKLRRFILDLAVRGKLVDQDPGEGTARDLLSQHSLTVETLDDSHAFAVPHAWVWATVGDVCSKTGSGSTPRGGKTAYVAKGTPFLRSQNVHDDGLRLDDVAYIDAATHRRMAGTAVQPDDLLLNITGGSMGRCCHISASFTEANISQHVAILRAAIPGIQAYLHACVISPYFQTLIFDEQTGAGRGGLPKNKMDRLPIPLPPLAEQHRIVAKVDELMMLCDRLEASRAERESRRDRLVLASLNRLSQPTDPDEFKKNAGFTLSNLNRFSTKPGHIKELRKAILNLAVSGRLVPQEEDNPPATHLLTSIAQKRQAGITTDSLHTAVPHDLPAGWVLATVQQLLVAPTRNGVSLKGSDTPPGTKALRLNAITDNGIDYTQHRFIPLTPKAEADLAIVSGDFLIVRGNGSLRLVGKAALALDPPFTVIFPDTAIRLRLFDDPSLQAYVNMAWRSPWIRSKIESKARTTAGIFKISQGDVEAVTIPLPPLAEQKRIVAKVDELMVICDQLEHHLESQQKGRRQLLEALLHEALEGVG